MKITVSFEYDSQTRVCRVISLLPLPPFGIGTVRSVLHDSHYPDEAKRSLRKAVDAALNGKTDALKAARPAPTEKEQDNG